LFPVSPRLAHFVPSLFSRNERVALNGEWAHGFFSFVPVAAYNVGGIRLCYPQDANLKTNVKEHYVRKDPTPYVPSEAPTVAVDLTCRRPLPSFHSDKKYESGGVRMAKGDEVAVFELGSTVVLLFEAPADRFRFRVFTGQPIKMGQNVGTLW